jgi:hypothetical protein
MFYGANGHWDYLQSPEEQIARLQMMGMEPGYYRVAWDGWNTLDYLVRMASALRASEADIEMICCLNVAMTDDNGKIFASEAEAYHAGHWVGSECAQALLPLGVKIFQCGNELDGKNGIRIPVQDVQGGVPEDFDNNLFPALRGVLRGCTDAVRRAGGPSVTIGSNAFTACSFACSDMLWDGTQPDGSSGHAPLRWDVTTWNNYMCYGSMLDMSMDYQKPNVNLLDHLKAKYGRPIFVTEWNGNEGDTDAQRTEHAKKFMADMYAWRHMFDVRALIVYQLICGDPWGVTNWDGTLQTDFGATVRDFIAANPA